MARYEWTVPVRLSDRLTVAAPLLSLSRIAAVHSFVVASPASRLDRRAALAIEQFQSNGSLWLLRRTKRNGAGRLFVTRGGRVSSGGAYSIRPRHDAHADQSTTMINGGARSMNGPIEAKGERRSIIYRNCWKFLGSRNKHNRDQPR
jgi:hypothetical protein